MHRPGVTGTICRWEKSSMSNCFCRPPLKYLQTAQENSVIEIGSCHCLASNPFVVGSLSFSRQNSPLFSTQALLDLPRAPLDPSYSNCSQIKLWIRYVSSEITEKGPCVLANISPVPDYVTR